MSCPATGSHQMVNCITTLISSDSDRRALSISRSAEFLLRANRPQFEALNPNGVASLDLKTPQLHWGRRHEPPRSLTSRAV